MVAYVVNQGFSRGKVDTGGSCRCPILLASRAVRSGESRTAHVIAPDPVSAAAAQSEDLDDSCSTRPSDTVERTDMLVLRRPSTDPSSTSQRVSWEPASEFFWRTSCSIALSSDRSAAKRLSFVFSSRSCRSSRASEGSLLP